MSLTPAEAGKQLKETLGSMAPEELLRLWDEVQPEAGDVAPGYGDGRLNRIFPTFADEELSVDVLREQVGKTFGIPMFEREYPAIETLLQGAEIITAGQFDELCGCSRGRIVAELFLAARPNSLRAFDLLAALIEVRGIDDERAIDARVRDFLRILEGWEQLHSA